MKWILTGLIALSLSVSAEAKPNLMSIFTDDQGYGDLSAYRQTDVRTPNIDRIARKGMLFTNMRANCTVCSPSRAALLTGLYPDRVSVPGVIRTQPEDSWGCFAPKVSTLADELKKEGYHSAIIGKWHLGLESPNGWKLMQNDPFAPLELYHLAQDTQERVNLIATEKQRRDALLKRMRVHIQNGGATPWQPPTP